MIYYHFFQISFQILCKKTSNNDFIISTRMYWNCSGGSSRSCIGLQACNFKIQLNKQQMTMIFVLFLFVYFFRAVITIVYCFIHRNYLGEMHVPKFQILTFLQNIQAEVYISQNGMEHKFTNKLQVTIFLTFTDFAEWQENNFFRKISVEKKKNELSNYLFFPW